MARDGDKLSFAGPVAIVLVVLALAYTGSWSGRSPPTEARQASASRQTALAQQTQTPQQAKSDSANPTDPEVTPDLVRSRA